MAKTRNSGRHSEGCSGRKLPRRAAAASSVATTSRGGGRGCRKRGAAAAAAAKSLPLSPLVAPEDDESRPLAASDVEEGDSSAVEDLNIEEEEDEDEDAAESSSDYEPELLRRAPSRYVDDTAPAIVQVADHQSGAGGPSDGENRSEPTVMTAAAALTASTSSSMRFGGGTQDSAVQADVALGDGPHLLRQHDHLKQNLKQNLECPVCSRMSLPPIMQCRNGHVTCNICRLKVRSCPMCREIDIDIRNMFAEKALTFMTIPCEFKQFGCKEEIPYSDKGLHENVCKFRPFNCPYIECDHKLAADDVVEHVSTAHRDDCRNSDGPEITASMILIGSYFGGDGAWSPRVITCFNKTFFDVALTRDRWLHHWVWILGEEEEAQQYVYEISAFKGNVKYLYGGEVSSLRVEDDDIVSQGQCLSISDPIGRRLREGDKIRYKLKLIKKSDCQR